MKYKVGDEVLVKAKIIGCSENGIYDVMANRATILETSLIDKIHIREDDIVPVPDMTAEEAWKILSKILLYPANGGYSAKELEEIFGTTEHLWELTPQEAKAKIEAWEAAKEIKVGDEVVPKHYPNNDDYKFFVTYIDKNNNWINGVSAFSGYVFSRKDITIYQKTGRHIDIESLLNKIGGE